MPPDLANLKCVCGHARDEHSAEDRRCLSCTCPTFTADQRSALQEVDGTGYARTGEGGDWPTITKRWPED